MGDQNSRRSRRRLRGKRNNDPNLVYEFGRWMVRTVDPVERIDLGEGYYAEVRNERWREQNNEPRNLLWEGNVIGFP